MGWAWAQGKRRFRSYLPTAQSGWELPHWDRQYQTNHIHPSMKYSLRNTNRSTARIAFESSFPYSPTNKPMIWRIFSRKSDPVSTSAGTVLGRDAGKTCALLIHVSPHDLIAIRETLPGMVGDSLRYFRIDADFQPRRIPPSNRFQSPSARRSLLKIKNTNELNQMDSTKGFMKLFFAQKHPTWLQQIVDRQLMRWRDNRPSSFFRLASSVVIESALPDIVETSPFSALACAKARLDAGQLVSCIQRSKKAAVMFAFDQIPQEKRKDYIMTHPYEAVEFAWPNLTDQEFRLAVHQDRMKAFGCLEKLPPHRQATILAYSYPYAFLAHYGGSLPRLQQIILTSLKTFPDEWIMCDGKGFALLFKGLRDWVKLEIDISLINTLLHRLNPVNRQALTIFISSRI